MILEEKDMVDSVKGPVNKEFVSSSEKFALPKDVSEFQNSKNLGGIEPLPLAPLKNPEPRPLPSPESVTVQEVPVKE
jgi:hypothetical protein